MLGHWRDTDASQIVLHLLVLAEETEPIMDRFEEHYPDTKGFHVLLALAAGVGWYACRSAQWPVESTVT